jgi:hypothetical protein
MRRVWRDASKTTQDMMAGIFVPAIFVMCSRFPDAVQREAVHR